MPALLGQEPRRLRYLRHSPSCYLMLVGSSARYARTVHHNIHFGRAWSGVFDEIIDRGELMSDPSLLVSQPTHSDPSLAPAGRHVYYVLFPTPNLSADIDWARIFEPLSAFMPDPTEHELKFLEPRVDLFDKHPSQVRA